MNVKLLFLAVLLCSAITATANDAKISGRIKDANDKSAIIGATVLLMQSHSADGNDATFLHNENADPNGFIICNIREEDCSVVLMLKDK